MANIRWMFGIYCRKTKIQVVYSLKDKKMSNILPIMKAHIAPGSMVFSDSHMGYCNMNSGTSRLSEFGFFHMWTNHSFRMVHEKFPFNSTLNVERGWSDIKKNCYSIKRALNYSVI
jgi:transposase-like protein